MVSLNFCYIIFFLLLSFIQIKQLISSTQKSFDLELIDYKNELSKLFNEPRLADKKYRIDNRIECLVCNFAIPLAQILIEKNETKHIKPLVADFCNKLKYLGPVVCDLLVEEYGVFIQILLALKNEIIFF
jgi:hypothetical protein